MDGKYDTGVSQHLPGSVLSAPIRVGLYWHPANITRSSDKGAGNDHHTVALCWSRRRSADLKREKNAKRMTEIQSGSVVAQRKDSHSFSRKKILN